MPDVHLAREVCVGLVVATKRLIYPAAVGGDIGCGIAAIPFLGEADRIDDADIAGAILDRLREAVPVHRHARQELPESLLVHPLSDPSLDRTRRRDGTVQFATLGRGNHFLEFQRDTEGRLWLMVHSGSRAMGQAIRAFHEARGQPASGGLKVLDADTPEGRAYLSDAMWACDYAKASRLAMARAAASVVETLTGIRADPAGYFDCDHNHVRVEAHFGTSLLIHRKGAMRAGADEPGMIPGSMATKSVHVTGRGNPQSLQSASHGAGRELSRDRARREISPSELSRQMEGVWFDARATRPLTEEAPSAYKDVNAVLRAEGDLVRVVRIVRPVLSYKGR